MQCNEQQEQQQQQRQQQERRCRSTSASAATAASMCSLDHLLIVFHTLLSFFITLPANCVCVSLVFFFIIISRARLSWRGKSERRKKRDKRGAASAWLSSRRRRCIALAATAAAVVVVLVAWLRTNGANTIFADNALSLSLFISQHRRSKREKG